MIGYFKRISDGARICSYVECAILICTAELCNSDVLCTGLCKPVQSSRSVCAIGRAGNHQKWLSLPLLILATLCANWRFSNPMLVIIMKMSLIMMLMMVMTYFSSHSSHFVPTGAFPRASPHQRHSKWTCDIGTHVFDIHPPTVIVQ